MTSGAYFNDNDPFVCRWLRNLIAAGHLPAGEVDERSIADVCADDVRGFSECHFFAGIGGWPLALRLAGWPLGRLVWTGSAPCQPFSTAGQGAAHEDRRHLWPSWCALIRECRPPAIFGEQVASPLGGAWLDHVCADLESIGYAAATANLPACSVGAPHGRPRLYFVADTGQRRRAEQRTPRLHVDGQSRDDAIGCGAIGVALGDAGSARLQGREQQRTCDDQGHGAHAYGSIAESSRAFDPWRDVEWLACSDGKARPTKPGLSPLADGIPGRVGRLRAYGNTIVPQVATQFIGAYLDLMESLT